MAYAIKIQPSPERLKVAHNALNKVKHRYSLEAFQNGYSEIEVEYYDQFDNFGEESIPRAELEAFILDHYSSVTDSILGGEHVQEEDNRTASEYLDDNLQSVLVDYLNARKA